MKNIALTKWREGTPSLGLWVNLPDIHLTETMARSDVDWLCFDLQHGLMDVQALYQLLPAMTGLPVTPLVRVAGNTPDQIGKALDAGAEGVIIPMVNTAEDAQRAVDACYYPPLGQRSCGPMRSAMQHGMQYLALANEQIACIPMIETREGLANVDAIAAVKGLDALFLGPMDLCYGLGLAPGDFGNEVFKNAVNAIVSACRKNGLAIGIFGYSPDMANASLAEGFNFASAGTDISFFRAGMARAIATARGQTLDESSLSGGY